MASLTFDDPDGISKSISDVPPTHYTMKIESFSLLMKNSIERYESRNFEAGGYKWNLVIYPNGNKSRNVKEHLSFYLAMAETKSLRTGWEVHAVFRLFVLDQNKDNYMIVRDALGKQRRFHRMKLEWGFDNFIPLKTFNDDSNGFLVDDTCVFGAEVFVCKERSSGNGECLRMINNPIMDKHTFWVYNYSKLDSECSDSNVFIAGAQKWKMRFFPKGKGAGFGTHVSFYLALADPATLPAGYKIYAEYTLRILSLIDADYPIDRKGKDWFSASDKEYGWSRFWTLEDFRNKDYGYLVMDTCFLEAEVTVHGAVDAL